MIKADVAELVDARDLKSLDGNVVWVRVPPPAPMASRHRESPQLPNVAPGLTGVLSFSTLNAKVNPARISFTARPLTSAWRNAASKLSLSFTCQIAPARAEYVCCWLMTLSE